MFDEEDQCFESGMNSTKKRKFQQAFTDYQTFESEPPKFKYFKTNAGAYVPFNSLKQRQADLELVQERNDQERMEYA